MLINFVHCLAVDTEDDFIISHLLYFGNTFDNRYESLSNIRTSVYQSDSLLVEIKKIGQEYVKLT